MSEVSRDARNRPTSTIAPSGIHTHAPAFSGAFVVTLFKLLTHSWGLLPAVSKPLLIVDACRIELRSCKYYMPVAPADGGRLPLVNSSIRLQAFRILMPSEEGKLHIKKTLPLEMISVPRFLFSSHHESYQFLLDLQNKYESFHSLNRLYTLRPERNAKTLRCPLN